MQVSQADIQWAVDEFYGDAHAPVEPTEAEEVNASHPRYMFAR